MTKLGKRLRELRLARDWTQEEAEERSEVPQTTISGLETGRVTRTSHETLVRLARAYGVRVRELYEVAGMIEPGGPETPEVKPDADMLAEMVARVRATPGLMAQIAHLEEEVSPETYQEVLEAIADAWIANIRMGMRAARAGRGN